MARRRDESGSPAAECSLEAGSREMSEPWKGALGCVGVALLFLMTIGVLYWQVAERPEPAWLLKGQLSGLVWHSKRSVLALRSVFGEQSFALIQPRHLPLSGHTLLTNRCWYNQSLLCSSWDGVSELQILLEPINQSLAECYRVEWTPRHCQVALKDCFSMDNVSWYGGGSMHSQYWPINNADIDSQPFIISNLQDTPSGYGSVLERYFLGSTGVAVQIHPEVPLHIGIESKKWLCLGVPPNAEMVPLRYTMCVSDNLTAVHQQVGRMIPAALPDTDILQLPFWRLQKAADIIAKLEHNARSLSNKLKQHQLGDGVLDLTEQYTQLLLAEVPFVMKWRGTFVVKLNLSNEEARNWFVAQAHRLHRRLDVKYITLEGGEGRPNINGVQHHSWQLSSDEYITQFTLLAEKLGNTTIISTATQTAHIPVFVRMAPRQSDWSYAGLKGVIPTVLHYSLLGYSFFIPDAVGGSLTKGFLADEELFIRWLQIVTFLPVMAFSTPPWVFGENWIVNMTQMCIQRHQSFVVPLIRKQAVELASLGHPVFRPLWWVSPDDPKTLTIDDEFLIGDEVLVAPVTAPGRVHRDIYLPGSSYQWKDVSTAQVFDGGTLLQDYPVPLTDVPVFVRQDSGDSQQTAS
ncbi:SITS-binding protein isoform X2 [Chiloscyllium plagiosum]|uniref:SITS-binding protein isoform X2 n=1 Tax=Chiloscyllium plagiosum TaxID=36176 RepID=UPI001CB7C4FB|nr:SITS-binding protein isoform X2 [Chiloscyllium plagiosum]